jgi:hypothetical protein
MHFCRAAFHHSLVVPETVSAFHGGPKELLGARNVSQPPGTNGL